MKKTTLLILTGLAFAASAQAGEDYSAKGAKVVIPPPAPCLWTWFAGGSAGYIADDWDEEIYTLQVGAEYSCPDAACTHAIYLEVGYTEKGNNFSYFDSSNTTESFINNLEGHANRQIIPITLNYKYECALTDQLNWYVGAGAGVAIHDLDVRKQNGSRSYHDTKFYAHIFAGLVYNLSQSVEIFGGARYIHADSIFSGENSPLHNEFQYELGARFNF